MGKHTATTRGKRVIVTLVSGEVLVDRFVERAKNRRWIELEQRGRLAMSLVKSFANLKGKVNLKRLGKESPHD